MTEIKQRYFACQNGHVVRRWGTNSYIGSVRTPQGYAWTDGEVVAIPEVEFQKYTREYNRCIRDGSLIEKTRSDWDFFVKIQSEESAKDARSSSRHSKSNEAGATDVSETKKNKR